MARLGDMARIFIGNTEVSDAGEFNHEVLNNLLLQKGIDPDTGLHISSVAEVGEEILERADEISLDAARALWPSFRKAHPSVRYLIGEVFLEGNYERAVKLIAAYLSLTGNGSMPEYGLVMAHDERYDCREKAHNRDEARALKEWRRIKKAQELALFENNLGREEGLETEYPGDGKSLSPRKERLEKQLTSKTIAGYEKLVTDDGGEIAGWLCSLSDDDLDFFIGDAAPYLKDLSRVLHRFAGQIEYTDAEDPGTLISGLFQRILQGAAFRSGYQGLPITEVAGEVADQWTLAPGFIQQHFSSSADLRKRREEGWGVSMWEMSLHFARSYDISGREAKLTDRDKAIAAVAIAYGKYTRAEPALAWGGFLSRDEARHYLDGLNLKPERLEKVKARVFGAMSLAYRERQDYIQHGIVPVAERFAREVWHCLNCRRLLSNTEKLVAALGLLYSPYLARRRTFALNWGGYDSLDEARRFLERFPVPLPKDTLEYLKKKVTYAIYEQAPKMPKEAA